MDNSTMRDKPTINLIPSLNVDIRQTGDFGFSLFSRQTRVIQHYLLQQRIVFLKGGKCTIISQWLRYLWHVWSNDTRRKLVETKCSLVLGSAMHSHVLQIGRRRSQKYSSMRKNEVKLSWKPSKYRLVWC